jgi:hypothetical protein
LPLLPELTRPHAVQERERIFEFSERIGRVSLFRDCVEYDSPGFEWETLSALNVPAHNNWRRADLLLIEAERYLDPPEVDIHTWLEWDTFVIKGQVIQVRKSRRKRRRDTDFFLKPARGEFSFLLNSVSARNPALRHVDVRTSRNRAAMAGDLRLLRYILTILAQESASLLIGDSVIFSQRVIELLGIEQASQLAELLSFKTVH